MNAQNHPDLDAAYDTISEQMSSLIYNGPRYQIALDNLGRLVHEVRRLRDERRDLVCAGCSKAVSDPYEHARTSGHCLFATSFVPPEPREVPA